MSVKNDGFAGDVIASSTLLVYEDPVVTEESPDASVVNTVTHSELVFGSGSMNLEWSLATNMTPMWMLN